MPSSSAAERTFYVLAKDAFGYPAGTPLMDVTLAEARSMECNRCGDCCNGLRDGVQKDEQTGFPLFQWGSNAPDDGYESRFGKRMLVPLVRGDGGVVEGDDWEVDEDGKRYTAFRCAFLMEFPEGTVPETSCQLYDAYDKAADIAPADVTRPLNCGSFPVFGLEVDDSIIDGHAFVPPTGPLPRCTWHGIRVVGPWKNEPYWRERWKAQQEARRGEEE